MRRTGRLWPRIVSFENFLCAARRAARGKRHVAGVARFLADLEPNVLALQRELAGGTWRPGCSFQFEIHDPKRRTITAAPFRDRVVHHALMDVLEPILDRRMVRESFACRRGKGTHAALAHARRLVRRHRWFLKLDVARCFESLDHEVVLETMARILKDRRVLGLCERIVRAGGREGVGLPIGNLTSQWFANLVLDRLDHHVQETLGVRGYVRYMDDFVLFAAEKARLAAALDDVGRFLNERLRLRLKERATILAPATEGLPFLGWRILRGTTRLRPANLRRTRSRVRHRLGEYRRGEIGEDQLAAALRSVCEHLRHGNTLSLRRRWFEGLGRARVRGPPGSP
ncbi:MAG: reverse transcriptase/maturase family protein [Planctomycetota bacterium]